MKKILKIIELANENKLNAISFNMKEAVSGISYVKAISNSICYSPKGNEIVAYFPNTYATDLVSEGECLDFMIWFKRRNQNMENPGPKCYFTLRVTNSTLSL